MATNKDLLSFPILQDSRVPIDEWCDTPDRCGNEDITTDTCQTQPDRDDLDSIAVLVEGIGSADLSEGTAMLRLGFWLFDQHDNAYSPFKNVRDPYFACCPFSYAFNKDTCKSAYRYYDIQHPPLGPWVSDRQLLVIKNWGSNLCRDKPWCDRRPVLYHFWARKIEQIQLEVSQDDAGYFEVGNTRVVIREFTHRRTFPDYGVTGVSNNVGIIPLPTARDDKFLLGYIHDSKRDLYFERVKITIFDHGARYRTSTDHKCGSYCAAKNEPPGDDPSVAFYKSQPLFDVLHTVTVVDEATGRKEKFRTRPTRFDLRLDEPHFGRPESEWRPLTKEDEEHEEDT